MATYIVEVKEVSGNSIGFGYFNTTVNCFIRPFADSKRGTAAEVFSTGEYMVIIETLYELESWGDYDHKIDSGQFAKFLRFMEAKVWEIARVKLDLSKWDPNAIEFFLKKADENSLTFHEAISHFVTRSYMAWKKQGNWLASPLF
jgi:hypothetical protein